MTRHATNAKKCHKMRIGAHDPPPILWFLCWLHLLCFKLFVFSVPSRSCLPSIDYFEAAEDVWICIVIWFDSCETWIFFFFCDHASLITQDFASVLDHPRQSLLECLIIQDFALVLEHPRQSLLVCYCMNYLWPSPPGLDDGTPQPSSRHNATVARCQQFLEWMDQHILAKSCLGATSAVPYIYDCHSKFWMCAQFEKCHGCNYHHWPYASPATVPNAF